MSDPCPQCGHRRTSRAVDMAILEHRLEQSPGSTVQERLRNLNVAPELSPEEVALARRVALRDRLAKSYQERLAQAEAAHAEGLKDLERRLDEAAEKDPAIKAWLDEPIELHPDYLRALERERRIERMRQVEGVRKRLGLTQAQAAKRMGLARTTVVAIEQGKRGVSQAELDALQKGGESDA